MNKKHLGLRERIAQAKSEDEIQMLLGQSRVYDHASAHTRRGWANTAARRIETINNRAKG